MAQAGSIKEISGSVSAQSSTGQVRELNVGDIIYENELIVTTGGSRVTIELDNGKTINLSENAQILIDESVIGVVDARDAVVSEVEGLQAALEAGEEIGDEEATAVGEEDDAHDFGLDYYAGDQTRGEVGSYLFPTDYALPAEVIPVLAGEIEEVVLEPEPTLPVANPDIDETAEGVEGDGTITEGNVLENDLSGDGAIIVTAVGGSAANVGVPITTALGGTITINADGSYSYIPPAQTDHSQGEVHDIISYTITNTEGNSATTTLDINVLDTAPTAVEDFNTVVEGEASEESDSYNDNLEDSDGGRESNNQVSGNVLTNDVESADTGMTVTNPGTYTGTYGGILVLLADGSYTYTAPDSVNNADGDPKDVFNYTMEDGDGTTSSSTLTITITDGEGPGAPEPATLNLVEDDLLGTTAESTDDTGSALSFTLGSDNLASIVFNGTVGSITGGYDDGTITWLTSNNGLTLTGTVSTDSAASITLNITGIDLTTGAFKVDVKMTDEFTHTAPSSGADINNFVITNIEVIGTDIDGDPATANINVEVTDDVPTISITGGDTSVTEGASITNGTWTQHEGADGATTEITVSG